MQLSSSKLGSTHGLHVQQRQCTSRLRASRASTSQRRPYHQHHRGKQLLHRGRHIARVATPEIDTVQEHSQQQQRQQQHTQQQQQHSNVHLNGASSAPSDGFQPITAMWARNAAAIGDQVALLEPHRTPTVSITYRELAELIVDFAAGLRALGLQQGDRVSLFAESSSRWIVADQGVLMNGAADAVRGSSSPVEELSFIMGHSGSSALILQDRATLVKLLPAIKEQQQQGGGSGSQPQIKFVAVLWDEHGPPAAAAASNGSKKSRDSSAAAAAAAEAELEALGVHVLGYHQVLAAGQQQLGGGATTTTTTTAQEGPSPSPSSSSSSSFVPAVCQRGDLATLVYTSGTTGHPKGVMLTHGNLAYQVDHLDYFLPVQSGDSTLSLLPPWHIYQRSVAYYLFNRGAREVFTSLRHFRDDLTAHPPDHFVCVPLVLDTLYNKVMSKLTSEAKGVKGAIVSALLSASYAFITARRVAAGVSLLHALQAPTAVQRVVAAATVAVLAPVYALAQKLVFSKVRAALGIKQTVISGGGSLAAHLDLFFEAVGLPVLNGWGLTETSPVLACRRPSANVRGSVGLPTPGTQVIVVDPTTHARLPDGQQGLILAAGPGVMSGYWQDTAATRKAFIDGWFDTGDLGWRAPGGVSGSNMAGHIVLTGRAKDTLVLMSGKNIEPQPIEDALCRSPYIKHVMLLGQDKRELGALVFPDEEYLAATGGVEEQEEGGQASSSSNNAGTHALEQLLLQEVNSINAARQDYHPEDHIAHIQVVRAPLSVESGTLTRTMKPRRPVIQQVYKDEVTQLLARLRG